MELHLAKSPVLKVIWFYAFRCLYVRMDLSFTVVGRGRCMRIGLMTLGLALKILGSYHHIVIQRADKIRVCIGREIIDTNLFELKK